MAPLPDNNTSRYWVDYSSNGREHSIMFRYLAASPNTEPTTAFIARVSTFFTDVASVRPTNFALLGARYSYRGTTVSLPATAPTVVAGTGAISAADLPAYWAWIGRSPAGRKFRLFLLGVAYDVYTATAANDYRLTPAENTVVSTTVANLQGWANLGGTEGLYAIDEVVGTDIYNYVNLGFNAYWQRKARGV